MPDSFVAYDEAPKDSFVAYDAGDLGGYKPGASASRKEHARSLPPSWLGPFKPLYNAVDTSLGEGSQQMYQGLQGLASFPGWDESAHNASQVIRGGLTAASPAAIPFALGSPTTVLPRMAKGLLAQYLVENAGKTFVPDAPGTSELLSDVAGLYAAGRTSKPSEPGPPGGPSGGGAGRYFKGALKPTDIFDVFSPVRLAKNVATRVGKNYMEASIPPPPETPVPTAKPTPSPTWKPKPIPPPEPEPAPIPRSSTNRVPDRAPAPKPTPPPKPGRSPSWSRGTVSPPPAEEVPTIEGNPISKEAIEAEAAKLRAKDIAAQSGERIQNPTAEDIARNDWASAKYREDVAKAAFTSAKHKFGPDYGPAFDKLIADTVGPNRTRAYAPEKLAAKLKEGKIELSPLDWQKIHAALDKLPFYKPSIPEPPK